jgi:predicted ester cyclase
MGFPPKGRSIDVETCEIYEVTDGIVVASWVYGDLGQLFRQIGTEQGDAT